jgi:thioredoxin 1
MEQVAELTTANFDNFLKSLLPTMVEFWSPTCSPCRMLAPILAELADENQGNILIAKVNAAAEMQLAARYGIEMLPTLIFFNNGKVVNQMVGLQKKEKIQQALDEID